MYSKKKVNHKEKALNLDLKQMTSLYIKLVTKPTMKDKIILVT